MTSPMPPPVRALIDDGSPAALWVLSDWIEENERPEVVKAVREVGLYGVRLWAFGLTAANYDVFFDSVYPSARAKASVVTVADNGFRIDMRVAMPFAVPLDVEHRCFVATPVGVVGAVFHHETRSWGGVDEAGLFSFLRGAVIAIIPRSRQP